MKNNILLLLSLVIVITGCSLFDDDGPKDPRDYTWTIDTLYYPGALQTNMNKIWASSPEDVYVIGHSSVLSGSMWHYNGRSWISVPIIELYGGPILNTNYSLNDIYGFSKYDVWVVGRKSVRKKRSDGSYYYDRDGAFIIHYNGVEWKEIEAPGMKTMYSINGISRNNLWLGTSDGKIFSYNGIDFRLHELPVDTPEVNRQWIEGIVGGKDKNVFVLLGNNLTNYFNESRTHLLKYNGEWTVIDTVTYPRTDMWLSPKGTLFIGGYNLRKYTGNDWEIVDSYPKTLGSNAIFGLSENYLFSAGVKYKDDHYYGKIPYYNGKVWTEILQKEIKDVIFMDVWVNKNVVFVIGITNSEYPSKTLVIKGE
ncbi:MAG: hypothetical protein ISR89_06945 [Candidatus Marinimicrobia bacterium]|nr:hypothetical protein [Candidatus Neomarinimicrobiota bacterium]MBL7030884.1 hypothetical protein [Candidatus Neomarinimicrobiota bacterium]